MTYLSEHYQKGDKFYLYHSSKPAFKYYAKRFGLEDVQLVRGVHSTQNWPNYVDDLKSLRGNKRMWILFSHVDKNHGTDEERFFLYVLDGMGRQVDSFKRKRASVYLYDLHLGSRR